MASASVTPRFYCHECRDEVRVDTETQTCSRCSGGFIEEMEAREAPAPPAAAQRGNNSRSRHAAGFGAATNTLSHPTDPAAAFAEMLTQGLLNPLRSEPAVPAPGNPGPAHHGYNTRARQQARQAQAQQPMEEEEGGEMAGVAQHPNFHIHFNHGGDDRMNFHGIMNYVIQRLSSDLGGGGGGQFLQIHGNPGDYAWGTAGLDTIITQLFNQIDPGSGAPPADEDTISKLPEIKIDQSHIDNGAQCPICMDDFVMSQTVKKLPCDHLFCPDCIKKWLEMHGTCPVCRKDLYGKVPDSSGDDGAMDLSNAGSSVS